MSPEVVQSRAPPIFSGGRITPVDRTAIGIPWAMVNKLLLAAICLGYTSRKMLAGVSTEA
jgi:hypothetical protein